MNNLSDRLNLALTSDARDLDSGLEIVPAISSPRILGLAWFLRLSSSNYWPKSPPVWQSRLQCSTLPALQKKNIAIWGYPETPNEDQPARHSAVPQIYMLTWALMPFLTQPVPRHPGPTQTAGRTLSTSDPSWP